MTVCIYVRCKLVRVGGRFSKPVLTQAKAWATMAYAGVLTIRHITKQLHATSYRSMLVLIIRSTLPPYLRVWNNCESHTASLCSILKWKGWLKSNVLSLRWCRVFLHVAILKKYLPEKNEFKQEPRQPRDDQMVRFVRDKPQTNIIWMLNRRQWWSDRIGS